MIDSFLQYLQYERNCSSRTVLSYHTDLLEFKEFAERVAGEWDVHTVDASLVRAWLLKLMEKGEKPRSVNRKLSTLRSFYRYLNRKGLCERNPTQRVVAPKVGKPLPVFFRKEEVDKAIASIEGDDYVAALWRLVIDFLFQTGVRRAELMGVKDEDVDFSRSVVSVVGKRNKQRLIPIGEGLKHDIKAFVEMRDREIVRSVPYLFVTKEGRQLTPSIVYYNINKVMRGVSTLKKCSPHVLRHTFATVLLDNDADINAIKETLGHSSLAATEVYTHTTFEQLQKVYKNAHPRAKGDLK